MQNHDWNRRTNCERHGRVLLCAPLCKVDQSKGIPCSALSTFPVYWHAFWVEFSTGWDGSQTLGRYEWVIIWILKEICREENSEP